jgi:transposase InsO family protein
VKYPPWFRLQHATGSGVRCVRGPFRPDFLDAEGPFTSADEAQAAVDAWVAHSNSERPHQALDAKAPVTPADRFAPVPAEQRNRA